MNYGLWISASGLATSMYRMDVAANNLANTETAGFKADYAMARQRDAAAVEDRLGSLPSNKMLEKLGAGAQMAPNRMTTIQGQLERTSRPMDLAISGDGYLLVQAGQTNKPGDLRLTRDGRLGINGAGELVQTSSGNRVLDDANQPIHLASDAHITVQSDGTVYQGREQVAKLALVTAGDSANFRKAGNGLIAVPEGQMIRRQLSGAKLEQGFVEKSTVDPVKTMLDITGAERSVAYGTRVIQTIDETMQRAIGTFGRVA